MNEHYLWRSHNLAHSSQRGAKFLASRHCSNPGIRRSSRSGGQVVNSPRQRRQGNVEGLAHEVPRGASQKARGNRIAFLGGAVRKVRLEHRLAERLPERRLLDGWHTAVGLVTRADDKAEDPPATSNLPGRVDVTPHRVTAGE